jgi:hypothetical protein
MKFLKHLHILTSLSALWLLAGCSSTSSSSAPTSSVRSYSGTASVGDFLTITLNPVAQTITYTDISNGSGGIIPYTVNSDGTYALNDSTGNLVAAYEVPNYALLIQATKSGPTKDQLALVTAVETGTISTAMLANNSYNSMQFRTAAGGLEVGSIAIDGSANVNVSSYWPFGAVNQNGGGQVNLGTFSASLFQTDPSGTFMKMADDTNNGAYDYVFGTPNGVFVVDTPNGAILALKKAASAAFDPSFAGAYKAIYYQKVNASTGAGNVETGTPSLANATFTITVTGQVTVQDTQGNTLLQAALIPVANVSYLVGTGELQDPCYGLFTFRVTTASSQQDVFVTFLGRAVLFSSFTAHLPWGSGNSYDYLYGVGLK